MDASLPNARRTKMTEAGTPVTKAENQLLLSVPAFVPMAMAANAP
jgi:hypothetical protein